MPKKKETTLQEALASANRLEKEAWDGYERFKNSTEGSKYLGLVKIAIELKHMVLMSLQPK